MELFDTHCHIHEADPAYTEQSSSRERWLKAGITSADALVEDAKRAGVTRAICVGTSLADSAHAVSFVQRHEGLWASIGIHPHDAKDYVGLNDMLSAFSDLATQPKVVAVGECGLDFYYTNSPKRDQIELLEFQLEVAAKHDVALIFHIRDAFDEFWPIFDNYKGLRGIVHSFTADTRVLDQALSRGLSIGLNGIMTFTKDNAQLAAAKAAPLDRIVVETDAPYLTPAPQRGKICTSSHVVVTAGFLAHLRGEPIELFASTTTNNAMNIFRI